MRDLDHARIAEQPDAEQVHDAAGVCIFALPVPQRHIDGAAFLHGKADAGDLRPVRVQRGPRLCPESRTRRRFKVKGDDRRIGQIGPHFRRGRHTLVFHLISFLRAKR